MDKDQLLIYLNALNEKMRYREISGELHMYGGEVMCLVLNARQTTKDIDAWFVPAQDMRELISQVARENGIEEDWLNDGVKGFISENDEMEDFLTLSNLRVCAAKPEYVFAMKCMAARTDSDSKDVTDIKFLINYLGLKNYEEGEKILLKYFPENLINIKTQLLLESIFDDNI